MKRSAPLKRSAWPTRKPAAKYSENYSAERIKPVATPLTRPVRYAAPANDPVMAVPKTEPQRNPFLLTMARGERCLLQVPDVCNHDPSTTVPCHSNLSRHGKAGARKADDQYHVHGCSACHTWLDQGPASAEEKESRFMAAFAWMVAIWRDIDSGMQEATPRERAAARWALERISAA